MYSGLRLLEAYRLKRGDVDLDAKKMRVQKSKLWHGAVQYKEVPLRREVHEALKVYLSTRPLLPSANLFPFTRPGWSRSM